MIVLANQYMFTDIDIVLIARGTTFSLLLRKHSYFDFLFLYLVKLVCLCLDVLIY